MKLQSQMLDLVLSAHGKCFSSKLNAIFRNKCYLLNYQHFQNPESFNVINALIIVYL
jgi:hypothetical protein